MDAVINNLFAIFVRLGPFGLLILGVFDSSFLFMPLGNDLLMVSLTARQHGMLPVFAAMATIGSVFGCWLVDRIARKGGEEGLERIVAHRQLEFVKRDEAQFSGDLGKAQQLAARIEPGLTKIYDLLKEGEADEGHQRVVM